MDNQELTSLIYIRDVKNVTICQAEYEHERRRQDITNKLLQMAEKDDQVFVETTSCKNAQSVLEEHNIVLIVGSSGEGKDFIARRLIRNAINDRYLYQPVSKLADWERVNSTENFVVLIENAFQKTACCPKHCTDWGKWIYTIDEHIRSSNEVEGSIKIVITMKPEILGKMQKEFRESALFALNPIVDLTKNALSFNEKYHMFKRHAVHYKVSRFDECIKTICEYDTPCFPSCVRMFFSNKTVMERGVPFFANPIPFFHSEITYIYEKDKPLYTLLVLLLLHDGIITSDIEKLVSSTNNNILTILIGFSNVNDITRELKEVLSRNQPLYIRNEDGVIKCRFPSITEAVCIHFGENMTQESIKCLPFSFICDKISVSGSKTEGTDLINLREGQYSYLAQRFLTELEMGNIQQVCQHSAFTSQCFVTCFMKTLQSLQLNDKSKFKFILQITERAKVYGSLWNGSLLYWSASISNDFLCFHLLEKKFYNQLDDKFFVRTQASAALVIACWHGFRKKILWQLLELGADINSTLHVDRRQQTHNCDYCNTQDPEGMTMLQSAIYGDHFINHDIVEFILSYGVQCRENTYMYRPLIQAVKNRDISLVKLLLKYNVDVNVVDLKDNTALHYVVAYDDVEQANTFFMESRMQIKIRKSLLQVAKSLKMATFLITNNIDSNVTFIDENGRNLLHNVQDSALAQFLISTGCKVNQRDKFGRTPLFFAQKIDVVEVLLAHSANLHVQDNKGKNVLHCTTNPQILQLLINNMEPALSQILNQEDESGATPIFHSNNSEILDILLKSGSSINHKANTYTTKRSISESSTEDQNVGDLIYSKTYNDKEYRKTYLQNWISFSFGQIGTSSLDPTMSHERHDNMNMSSLESCSARTISQSSEASSDTEGNMDSDVNFDHCRTNYNVLMWLTLEDKLTIEMLEVLLTHSIDIMAQDNSNQTVLHYLLLPPNRFVNIHVTEIINQILEYVKRQRKPVEQFVNIPDKNGNTALHLVCSCRHQFSKLTNNERTEVIRILLNNGANANAHNHKNEIPLHRMFTCRCQNIHVVEEVLSRTSDINVKCTRLWTPLHVLMSIQDYSNNFIQESRSHMRSLKEAKADITNFFDATDFFPDNCNPILLECFLQEFYIIIPKSLIESLVEENLRSKDNFLMWTNVAVVAHVCNDTIMSAKFLSMLNKEGTLMSKHEIFKRCLQVLQNENLIYVVLSFLYNSNAEDIDIEDNEGNTILMLAVKGNLTGNINLVRSIKYLLKKGANPNAMNKQGESIVYNCISANTSEDYAVQCLKLLQQYKADLNDEMNYIWAAQSKKLRAEIIRLIPTDVFSNATDSFGNAFHHLIRCYCTLGYDFTSMSSIDAFQNRGVDINAKNEEGETPLHLAIKMNAPKHVVTELLRKEAFINIPNNENFTPYHYIFQYRAVAELEIFEEFVKTDESYCYGDITALQLIVCKMTQDTLKILLRFLLNMSCSVNSKLKNGISILHYACSLNDNDDLWCTSIRPQVVRLLLAKGANVNAVDSEGKTVLHRLVKKYESIYQSKPESSSLKHIHSVISIIDSVLSHNVDLSIVDTDGRTCTDYIQNQDIRNLIQRKVTPEYLNDKTAETIKFMETEITTSYQR